MRIGLLSDTHGFFDERLYDFFDECDEIWHAGDVGSIKIIEQMERFKPLRGVYGNIDDHLIRRVFPEDLRFECEGVDVFMTHIGGYPGRYRPRVREILRQHPPKLYICGHSHILKIMPDRKLDLLHVNPGAAGKYGFHKIPTAVRFTLEKGNISGMEVIELPRTHA